MPSVPYSANRGEGTQSAKPHSTEDKASDYGTGNGDTYTGTFTHGNIGGRGNTNHVTNYDGLGSQQQAFPIPDVPLKEFCEFYGINERDQKRLDDMEFTPGMDLEEVPDDVWKQAGFKALSWDAMKTKNQRFKHDVQNRQHWEKYFK